MNDKQLHAPDWNEVGPELLEALIQLVERGTDSPEHQAAERAIARATGAKNEA